MSGKGFGMSLNGTKLYLKRNSLSPESLTI